MKKIDFTWKEFDKALEYLYEQIMSNTNGNEFDSIYGIERGGLILAVCLSHKLNIPLVRKIGRDTLIVDDINDTGKTLLELGKKNVLPAIATIHSKESSVIDSDYVYKLVENDVWVIYPWELWDSITKKDNE